MDIKKLSGLSKLAAKAGLVFGTAFAALSIGNAVSPSSPQTNDGNDGNTIEFKEQSMKKKPMPLLKLNPSHPEQSLLVAQHGSHSSHSSHYSHSSHRSGGMFS